ncbi:carboxypeptidase-like regulatory domain-containing protein [Thermococcus kodakarensis]|nr:carboxypeptidase-like regulatory domain-containing protein [Thermococcus kodakarensis]WCN28655.1 carboxypeptidase-like regulatory domain-containing protein [Thermococcus kodakarensis]WCN30953.1 carboxypeptidase-like regulatory domain-containing protein [Thermococcus kodakarensis]
MTTEWRDEEMKKLGVLLALLVLFGTLATGTVGAVYIPSSGDFGVYIFGSSSNVTISDGRLVLDATGSEYVRAWLNVTEFQAIEFDYQAYANNVLSGVSFMSGSSGVGLTFIEYDTGSIEVRKISGANYPQYDGSSDTIGGSIDAGTSFRNKYVHFRIEFQQRGTEWDLLVYKDGFLLYNLTNVQQHIDPLSIEKVVFGVPAVGIGNNLGWQGKVEFNNIQIYEVEYHIQLSLKDALSNQPLTGVTVKENGNVIGTLDDGGSLDLTKGTHTLTFEKSGYWSVTKTIDVQGDMTVSVEMYPDSAAFKFENFPSDISIPENTIYTLTFTLSPISTDAAYNTYLSLSGLSNVLEVQKDGQAVSPESGKYYLGDISGPTQISIKFKAGAVGQHGFTLSFESHDAIMSKTYTTTKSVTYTVEPLPFSVQMPSEWQVGQNELRISESSGQSYLITAVLKDSQGNEVWSDSHAFSPYEAYSFSVNVPSEGQYTLELQWNGQVATYDVTVNPAITLTTKQLTVEKGGEGTIVLHFKNPSSDVQYYTIKVSGGFLPSEINQSISVGPLTEKDVSIAFAVPEDLTYDAYELQVQVLQGNATVFQDKVAVSIGDSGGFTLFGGSSGNTWLWLGVGGLGLLALVGLARRR